MATATLDLAAEMGLTAFEYDLILEKLGRTPNLTELGMFAVMWSEHCGYKFSRPVLAYFSQYKKAMESGGHENAGVIPIGNGLGIAFKVESHNHPSAVEPYQGAATGVGGILHDGRKTDSLLELASIWALGSWKRHPTRSRAAKPILIRTRRSGNRRLWKLRGRPYGCRRSELPPTIFGQSIGQRDGFRDPKAG
jgi:hypothetical protein